MSDLDKRRVGREARAHDAGLGRSTRYGDALNRYLGADAHRVGKATPTPARPATAATLGVVLVGADDTATSCTAVDHAAIEAELRGWDLRILHVERPGRHRGPARDAGAGLLERLTDRVHASSPAVPVTSRLVVGSTASQLLAEARGADLVVVGHRHGPTAAAFGLSIVERLAGLHPGVIMVVRMPGWPPGPRFGHRPIVVGVEQLAASSPATRFALVEAGLRGCELVMLRAGRGLVASGRMATIDGVAVHRRTVDTDPAKALTDFSHRAAAVVVGRRAAGAHPLAMLGSVSRAMVEHAGCPVFLV